MEPGCWLSCFPPIPFNSIHFLNHSEGHKPVWTWGDAWHRCFSKIGMPIFTIGFLIFSSLNDQELGYTSKHDNNWMITWFLQFGYTTWNQQKCRHDSTKELQKSQTSSAPSSPDHLVGSKVLPTAAQDVPPEPLVAHCRKCDAKSAPSGRLRTPIPTCFGGHITMQGPSWLTYCWSIIIVSRWKWSLSPSMSPQFPQCSS